MKPCRLKQETAHLAFAAAYYGSVTGPWKLRKLAPM